MEIWVENIKCGGCANGIKKQLLALPEIDAVEVEIDTGRLILTSSQASEALRETVCATLLKMGYPEKGSVQGLQAAGAKAKSFVSCAVGKMQSE